MTSAAPSPPSMPSCDATAARVFQLPLGARLLSIVAVIFLIGVTGIMVCFAVLSITFHWALGLLLTACAGFIGALVGYCLRDLRGKQGLRIALARDAVTLDLPTGRSLVHRPPEQHLIIPYADIEAIEARWEGYRSLGMAMMQRAYVLRKRNDELIFLFEERAQGTRLASSYFADIVSEIITRAHVPLRDRGTVAGDGGFLGTWGTHAPDWAAPPLPRNLALRLWSRAATTGSLTMLATLLLMVMRWLFGKG